MSTKKKSDALKFLESVTGGPVTLGGLLEAIRLGEEMSQVGFAKKLGISRAHLCDLEKGRRTLSAARAAKFAKTLGYSAERFVKLALQEELDHAKLGLVVDVRRMVGKREAA